MSFVRARERPPITQQISYTEQVWVHVTFFGILVALLFVSSQGLRSKGTNVQKILNETLNAYGWLKDVRLPLNFEAGTEYKRVKCPPLYM